jgi:hypothetical protein
MDLTLVQDILKAVFAVDSIWSVVARGLIWFVIAVVIIINTDTPNPSESLTNLKANLGFVVIFLILSSGLVYLLFGFTPSA